MLPPRRVSQLRRLIMDPLTLSNDQTPEARSVEERDNVSTTDALQPLLDDCRGELPIIELCKKDRRM
jgi:hypothetical protein